MLTGTTPAGKFKKLYSIVEETASGRSRRENVGSHSVTSSFKFTHYVFTEARENQWLLGGEIAQGWSSAGPSSTAKSNCHQVTLSMGLSPSSQVA